MTVDCAVRPKRILPGTVEVAPRIWCRWAEQDAVLRLPANGPAAAEPTADELTVELSAADVPAWRRQEHAAGRRLLAALLADVAPAAVGAPIKLRPGGKPELVGLPVGISIAHSHPTVAAAVAIGWDVGVDVEAGGPDDDRRWSWTVREACVKATGTGLAGRPWRIPVADRSTGQWQDVHWRALYRLSPLPLSIAWLPRAADQPPRSVDQPPCRRQQSTPNTQRRGSTES